MRPAAPASLQVPRFELQGLLLPALVFDLEDDGVRAQLKAANLVEHELRHGDISAFLMEAARRGHLDEPIESFPALANSVVADSTFDATAREITALRASEPFTRASPCPAELEYLHKVSWYDLVREGQRCNPDMSGRRATSWTTWGATAARRSRRGCARLSHQSFQYGDELTPTAALEKQKKLTKIAMDAVVAIKNQVGVDPKKNIPASKPVRVEERIGSGAI